MRSHFSRLAIELYLALIAALDGPEPRFRRRSKAIRERSPMNPARARGLVYLAAAGSFVVDVVGQLAVADGVDALRYNALVRSLTTECRA